MTRQFDFTVGPETSEQPTIGTPSSDDDLITRGYADGRYTQGSEAVADIAAIKAILAADRADGDVVAELTNNRLYIFDSGSSATGDDDLVLTPDAGTGRWLAITPHNPGDKIDVANDVTGTLPVANGGTGVTSSTGSGSVVLSNSPALTTPNIGTPSAATLTNATGLPIDAGSTGTLPINRGGTGQTTQTAAFDALSPTTTKGDIIADDGTNAVRVAVGADGLILKADSTASAGVSWGSASSGSGEINYIDNPDAEANTTGWATYADAAGATPVDGTGGSPNVTWTRQSSVILRGNQSFQLTKDAANRQGEGVSYDFSIEEQDISKKLKIQFDFKTNEDAAYASGDLTVYIYDVTNAQLITPVDTDIIDGQNIFQTSFNSTTSTSYRLIFHVATTNASAWDAYIDNVIVGPGMTSQGAAIGPWTRFTPTWSASAPARSPDSGVWRRVGDTMELEVVFVASGTGTGASLVFTLPDGLSINLDAVSAGAPLNGRRLGGAIFVDSGTTVKNLSVTYTNSTQLIFTKTGEILDTIDGDEFASGDDFGFTARVPILEWAGKGIVPMLAEDNLSEWTTYTPAGLTGGEWGNCTDIAIQYRRVGDSIQLRGEFDIGTALAAEAQLDLPPGLTIGGTGTDTILAGDWAVSTVFSSASVIFYMLATAGDTYFNMSRQLSTTNTSSLAAITADNFGIAGTRQSFCSALIPIQEWSGSQNSLVGYSLASETQTGLVSTGDQTFSGEKTFADNIVTPTINQTGSIYNRNRNRVAVTGTLTVSTNYDITVVKSGGPLDLLNFQVTMRVDNNNGTTINTRVNMQILDSNDNSVLANSGANDPNDDNQTVPNGFDDYRTWTNTFILKRPVGNYIFRFVVTTPGGGSVIYTDATHSTSVCAIALT